MENELREKFSSHQPRTSLLREGSVLKFDDGELSFNELHAQRPVSQPSLPAIEGWLLPYDELVQQDSKPSLPAKSVQEQAVDLLERMKSFDSEVSSMKVSGNFGRLKNEAKKLKEYADKFIDITDGLRKVCDIEHDTRAKILKKFTEIENKVSSVCISETGDLGSRLRHIVSRLTPKKPGQEVYTNEEIHPYYYR